MFSMGHAMNTAHEKDHHHGIPGAIALNLGITLMQVIGGILSNSLALLSDALHNLGDSLSLVMAWFAGKVGRRAADRRLTFGYGRAEVIAALLNTLLLTGITVFLFTEAIHRFSTPEAVRSDLVIVFALAGLVANVGGMLLLRKGSHASINVRAAYVHLLGDALSSLAVIAGGIVMHFTEIPWIDPLLTLVIGAYILYQAYPILKESIGILMLSAPSHQIVDEVVQALKRLPEIRDVHHVHIWRLDDHAIHLEAHLDLAEDLQVSQTAGLYDEARRLMKEYFDIHHVTLQMEYDFCESKEVIHQTTYKP